MKRKAKKIVNNPRTRRVENICFSRTCYIMYKTYCIGELTEESNCNLTLRIEKIHTKNRKI